MQKAEKMAYPCERGYGAYKRYCKTLTLEQDADLIEAYKKAHEAGAAWPEITQGMIEVGILDMEIYLVGNRLFMIMETADDFSFERKAAMDAVAAFRNNAPQEDDITLVVLKVGRET